MEKPNIQSALPAWAKCIADYVPRDEREAAERRIMLDTVAVYGDVLLVRENTLAHMTASAMIVNRQRTKVLMAYHRIYQSWSWTGGHNDGETDFEGVARREAREETGIKTLRRLGEGIASLEILPVWAHVKRGQWVGSHLHLNVSYLFEADEGEPLVVCEDENSAVGWVEVDKLEAKVSEAYMLPIYKRLIDRANIC